MKEWSGHMGAAFWADHEADMQDPEYAALFQRSRVCTGDFMTCPHDALHDKACGWHPDNVTTLKVSPEVFDWIVCDGDCKRLEDHAAHCDGVSDE